jgi:LysR family transcriptional regulator, nitrogen assimilation regulatory protein
MELKELAYFRKVAEFGTLSKAATYLHIAQPALSRHMQKLEHELGVELLKRTSRGVMATQAGQVLLERTLHLREEMEEIRREVSKFAKQPRGVLRVALGYPLAVLMVPQLVKAYNARYPEVALHFVQGFNSELSDGLLSGDVDIAISEAPGNPHADLNIAPLWMDTLCLVGPASAADTPLFHRESASVADLANLPILIASQRHALRRLVDAAFARQHLKFQPAFEVDGPRVILEMVTAGLGYALMPTCAFYSYQVRGEVVAIPVRPSIRRTVSIITRTALLGGRAVTPLLELIIAAAPRIIGSKQFAGATLF